MIVRAPRNVGFTTVQNDFIDDDRLSFRAKGVMIYILSKPDHWSISERHLADEGPDGRSAVATALKELETTGYLQRTRHRHDDGTFTWKSVVFETPQTGADGSQRSTVAGKTSHGLTVHGKPSHIVNTDQQYTDQQEEKIAATPPPPTPLALAPESVLENSIPEPQPVAPPPAWYEADPEPPAPPVVVENIPTTRTITDTPVVALYRDTFLRFPPKAQMVWLLQQDVTDLRRWRDVLDLWLGKGWAPTNLNGMVDLYRNPNRINELRNFSQERTNANVSANRNTAPGTRSLLAKSQGNAAGSSHLIPGGASNQRPTATLMPFDENGTDGWL